jgi:hypothetical protein
MIGASEPFFTSLRSASSIQLIVEEFLFDDLAVFQWATVQNSTSKLLLVGGISSPISFYRFRLINP